MTQASALPFHIRSALLSYQPLSLPRQIALQRPEPDSQARHAHPQVVAGASLGQERVIFRKSLRPLMLQSLLVRFSSQLAFLSLGFAEAVSPLAFSVFEPT